MTLGRIILFFVVLFLFGVFSRNSYGQRTTISTWSGSDDITIRSVGMGYNSLNFNQHSNKITANSGTLYIRKEDDNTAIFEIEAPSEFQLAINLDYTQYLAKEGDFSTDGSIPMVLYMAYHNQNAPNEAIAKKESVDLPLGTTGITIPVNSRFVVPLSPSEYGGNLERPKSVVYLYVFGTLGPIRSVTAGNYSSQISIHVNVADEKN